MTQDNENDMEIWQRMYEEEMRQARHHETLRFHSTSIIILISTAILAYLSSDSVPASNVQNFMMGAFLFVVNVFGVLIGLKHYERNRQHAAFGGEYRKLIFTTQGRHGLFTTQGRQGLKESRESAEDAHRKRFRIIHKIRAYFLWGLLHGLFASLGVCFMILSLC